MSRAHLYSEGQFRSISRIILIDSIEVLLFIGDLRTYVQTMFKEFENF